MKTLNTAQFLHLLINLISNLIELLLGLRIILKLFGASTASSFVAWVYETTQPLLGPFIGMFPSPRIEGGFIIEFSSLFALIVYVFVAYLAAELVEAVIASNSNVYTSKMETKKKRDE